MIRIIKGAAPAALIRNGVKQTKLDHIEYTKHTADYNSGAKKFNANDSIYNSDAVRNELLIVQNDKCCYCETKDVRSNKDVEHFRPKRAYSETDGGLSRYPGYFWLAYDWDNLFLSCQVCNQIFKNDFFPIENETTRAQSNGLSIDDEVSVLIHPYRDIPEENISYRESVPYGLTDRGIKTIEYLSFGRIDPDISYSAKKKAKIKLLVKKREEYYQTMKILFDVVTIFRNKSILSPEEINLLNDAQTKLQQAQQPDAEWSAMIRKAVQDKFKVF